MTRSIIRIAGAALALATFGVAASAADVVVTCEKRANRSKVSVDASKLAPGSYYARASSGGSEAQALAQTAVRGEVQFDFDSDHHDIATGATAIAPGFIVDGKVTGTVYNASGVEVASATGSCRVRR
jgi:hypothetical protein